MWGFRKNKELIILDYCNKSKNILHIGCTNSPNTKIRYETNTLLHKKICDVSKKNQCDVTGIDIDAKAINWLQEKMPNEKLLLIDAQKLEGAFNDNPKFDLIVAGDVIEHLDNPGLFFESCRKVLSNEGILLITTVNAYGISRFLKSFLFHEAVHPEHTFYFSHKTLSRLLRMNRLIPEELGYYKCEPITDYSFNRVITNSIENIFTIIWPQFSEGCVVIAKIKHDKNV